MDGPGLNMLARCVEANTDAASALHDSLMENLERENERLRDELAEYKARELRAWDRAQWLLGYEEGD